MPEMSERGSEGRGTVCREARYEWADRAGGGSAEIPPVRSSGPCAARGACPVFGIYVCVPSNLLYVKYSRYSRQQAWRRHMSQQAAVVAAVAHLFRPGW